MDDMQLFENILDGLQSEIEDMEVCTERTNLEDIHSGLYGVYERLQCLEIDKLQEEHVIMKDLLAGLLSHEDKLYYRIKYGIDIN